MLFIFKQTPAWLIRSLVLYRIVIKPWLRKPIFFIYRRLNFKIVTRDRLVGYKDQVQFFGGIETVTASTPHTVNISKAVQEIENFQVEITPPFICEIANADLVGPAAVAFDADGGMILESTTPFYSHENHLEGSVSIRGLAIKNFSTANTYQVDIASSLVNAWSRNYWHWIIDCLTRLEGIEYYHQQTGIKPKLIIDANPTKWQTESLKLLGYNADDCIEWNRSRMRVKKLIVSSFRRHYDRVYSVESPAACRWIRQRMLSNLTASNTNFSSNIFISRRHAEGRRIVNEDQVIALLAKLGFVTYVLEQMSFIDEVRLFAQAKVVVAPHGAGLTNIIFAENLTVIELFGVSVAPCFANLARGLGFNYGYLKCESPRTAVRHHDSDIIVDLPQLQDFLVTMLNASMCA